MKGIPILPDRKDKEAYAQAWKKLVAKQLNNWKERGLSELNNKIKSNKVKEKKLHYIPLKVLKIKYCKPPALPDEIGISDSLIEDLMNNGHFFVPVMAGTLEQRIVSLDSLIDHYLWPNEKTLTGPSKIVEFLRKYDKERYKLIEYYGDFLNRLA